MIEVCEETHLKKGKFEGVEPSDKDAGRRSQRWVAGWTGSGREKV